MKSGGVFFLLQEMSPVLQGSMSIIWREVKKATSRTGVRESRNGKENVISSLEFLIC